MTRVVALGAAVLAACSTRDANQIVGGVWAVRGKATYRDESVRDGRAVAAGHVLRRGGVIALDDAEVAIEGFNGLVAYVRGRRTVKVASLKPLEVAAPHQREVRVLGDRLETRSVPPFPVASRYAAPAESPPEGLDDEATENLNYFFTPRRAPADPGSEPARPPPPPAVARSQRYVHGIRVRAPPPSPDAPRALVEAEGPVVVELDDLTCAFAQDFTLPLALVRVQRIAVLDDGEARVRVDGTVVDLDEGEELRVGSR